MRDAVLDSRLPVRGDLIVGVERDADFACLAKPLILKQIAEISTRRAEMLTSRMHARQHEHHVQRNEQKNQDAARAHEHMLAQRLNFIGETEVTLSRAFVNIVVVP
jgi:hypothetical protein